MAVVSVAAYEEAVAEDAGEGEGYARCDAGADEAEDAAAPGP